MSAERKILNLSPVNGPIKIIIITGLFSASHKNGGTIRWKGNCCGNSGKSERENWWNSENCPRFFAWFGHPSGIVFNVDHLWCRPSCRPGRKSSLIPENNWKVGNREDPNIQIKIKAAQEIGMNAENIRLPKYITEGELISKILSLNDDSAVHGIIVQLPLKTG